MSKTNSFSPKQLRKTKRQGKASHKLESRTRLLTKRLLGGAGLLFVLTLLIMVMIQLTNHQQPTTPPRDKTTPVVDGNKSENRAPVTLIEYTDLQCPACAGYHRLIEQLKTNFSGSLNVVYKHFPLQFHRNAELAARVVLAAGHQGKATEMQNLLFEKQRWWAKKPKEAAEAIFGQYATMLNLKLEQFQQELHSQAVRAQVQRDYEEGRRIGVNGTPTFFLNGQKITRYPHNYQEFETLVKEVISGGKRNENPENKIIQSTPTPYQMGEG